MARQPYYGKPNYRIIFQQSAYLNPDRLLELWNILNSDEKAAMIESLAVGAEGISSGVFLNAVNLVVKLPDTERSLFAAALKDKNVVVNSVTNAATTKAKKARLDALKEACASGKLPDDLQNL